MPVNFLDPRLPERFWSKVSPCPTSGCWLWIGATSGSGYGNVHRPGLGQTGAHRHAYESLVGPVPDGLQLDHLCRVRSCCNPAHLEPVTAAVNLKRSPITNFNKSHCPRGHEYTSENTYHPPGPVAVRACRACARDRVWRRPKMPREAPIFLEDFDD